MKSEQNLLRDRLNQFIEKHEIKCRIVAEILGCHVSGIYLRKCGTYVITEEEIRTIKKGYYHRMKNRLARLKKELITDGIDVNSAI